MKKALVMVSFGTVRPGTGASALHTLASLVARQWPDYSVYQAYTSAVIRRRLAQMNLPAQSLTEVLEQLCRESVEEVRVCPVLLCYGSEYGKILAETQPFLARFSRLVLSRPLFAEEKNQMAMAQILSARLPVCTQGEGYLLVGHGTNFAGNECCEDVGNALHRLGRTDVYAALLVGQPGIEEAIAALKRERITRATIVPLLLTAGKHTTEDLAGSDPESCKSHLERESIRATCILKGLLEYPEVQQLYLNHFETGFSVE